MFHRVFTAFAMCLAKYTRFPLIKGEWDDDLQPVSEAFLPVVGLAIGLIWWILALLCWWILPGFLGAALVALFPFAVTGFENLCAFTRIGASLLEKKRYARAEVCLQILPAVLMLLQFSVCVSLDRIFVLAMIPVLSRSCLVLMQMKPKKEDGEDGQDELQVPVSLIRIEQAIVIGALVLLLLFTGGSGLISGAAVLASFVLIQRCFKKCGGEYGDDVHAFALTAAEFCGLLIMSIL